MLCMPSIYKLFVSWSLRIYSSIRIVAILKQFNGVCPVPVHVLWCAVARVVVHVCGVPLRRWYTQLTAMLKTSAINRMMRSRNWPSVRRATKRDKKLVGPDLRSTCSMRVYLYLCWTVGITYHSGVRYYYWNRSKWERGTQRHWLRISFERMKVAFWFRSGENEKIHKFFFIQYEQRTHTAIQTYCIFEYLWIVITEFTAQI